MDDEVNKAYAAAPTRLYLVGLDGRVVYAGGLVVFVTEVALHSHADASVRSLCVRLEGDLRLASTRDRMKPDVACLICKVEEVGNLLSVLQPTLSWQYVC